MYDGAHERYVVDEEMREKLRRANPRAFDVLAHARSRGARNVERWRRRLGAPRTLYAETEDELGGQDRP